MLCIRLNKSESFRKKLWTKQGSTRFFQSAQSTLRSKRILANGQMRLKNRMKTAATFPKKSIPRSHPFLSLT